MWIITESSFKGKEKLQKGFCFSLARDINEFSDVGVGLSVKGCAKG